jgi:hypothetical protein
MAKKIFLLVFIFCSMIAAAQKPYWQQRVDYLIDVTLNDTAKTLDGFEKLTYTNNSPDTLHFIWFHLWPNAYKNDRTTFSEQLLLNNNTKFYFSGKEEKGYINRLDFKVNGTPAKTEDHPNYIDVIKLLLPQPLLPGEHILVTTGFHEKLPFNFSRGGYDGNSFQVTQWYPKPAVYDVAGWHPMPYLDQGEFYSEFGSFDVRIHTQRDFMIAATGKLVNDNGDGYTNKEYKSSRNAFITWQFVQDSVHDFAWFANKDFIVDTGTVLLSSGKPVHVFSYYTNAEKKLWQQSVNYAKDAVRFYSDAVGDYPYENIKVVQGPESFGGGMEYPTITIISPTPIPNQLDVVIAHELGHNWFYGMLATNEREHPWMDEGINSFFERAYQKKKYGSADNGEELVFQTLAKTHKDQPIETSSENFSETNYGLVAYYKTAKWLELIRNKMGEDRFNGFIHEYFQTWKFRHPQPSDFKALLDKWLPSETNHLFALLGEKGILPGSELKGAAFITPFQLKKYISDPAKNTFIISPSAGFNVYDGLMAGVALTNYKLPPASVQFFASPLYGFRSKKINGIARAEYNIYPGRPAEKIELFTGFSSFSNDAFTDEASIKHIAKFQKFSGGITYQFGESNPLSQKHRYIQWKSFFIGEQPFQIRYDSVFTPTDTLVKQVTNVKDLQYSIHQLKLLLENERALYPYSFSFIAEGATQFVRLNVEGNYFFNYRDGGLAARVYAGKFFYNKDRQLSYGFYMDRFFLDLSGSNGYGDYTYSNYFVGRNEFEGPASRQITIRDGGFKIRTDLLGNRVGLSDDWLAAINLNTSIPSKFNPLSVLPIKIPLHLFADIGTFAGALKNENSSGRFLYDAGLHIPLFGGIVNFYFPILYSSEYRDYVKSVYDKNRFIKKSTFSIDLKKLDKTIRRSLLL